MKFSKQKENSQMLQEKGNGLKGRAPTDESLMSKQKNITILIVDDESSVLKIMSRIVNSMGHDFKEASDGLEALKIFNECKIDLVVTDVRMPGMDGVSLLREVKQRNPEMKVIFVTALSAVQDTEELKSFGAFEVVVKPFSVRELMDSIRKALGMTSV